MEENEINNSGLSGKPNEKLNADESYVDENEGIIVIPFVVVFIPTNLFQRKRRRNKWYQCSNTK